MEIEDGRVLGFSVNYRAQIGGDWVEVVRYDTDHGHLHKHENWKEAEQAITPLEDEDDPEPPYNEAFAEAEADLKANWQDYRRKMERKVLGDG